MRGFTRPAGLLKRFTRSERGTQLVELAIVLPVLLVLFGATAEFGRFFYTYQTLTKATRAGARYLTTEAAGPADLKAQNLVVFGNTAGTGDPVVAGLTADNVTVTREGISSAMPDHVTVRIEGYTYRPIFDLGKLVGSKRLSLRIDLSPSTTMRSFSTIPG